MTSTTKWLMVSSAVAVLAAMSPVGASAAGNGVMGLNDAQCLDCKVDPNYTCGDPPLDRAGYCTAGKEWCKAEE